MFYNELCTYTSPRTFNAGRSGKLVSYNEPTCYGADLNYRGVSWDVPVEVGENVTLRDVMITQSGHICDEGIHISLSCAWYVNGHEDVWIREANEEENWKSISQSANHTWAMKANRASVWNTADDQNIVPWQVSQTQAGDWREKNT